MARLRPLRTGCLRFFPAGTGPSPRNLQERTGTYGFRKERFAIAGCGTVAGVCPGVH
ncbi:hypothetical protein HDU93_006298, partial [Gonapodya sp. JEL0774]